MHIELTRPHALSLLALLPFWALLVWPRAGRGVPYTGGAAGSRRRLALSAHEALILAAPRLLTGLALASVIVALSGPVRVDVMQDTETVGHGISLVVDLSSSMLAEDMGDHESRISLAREAAVRFARRRSNDQLSLVGFGGEAVTRIPPTMDRNLIVQGAGSLEIQLVRDGTDISAAVLTAMSRLLQSEREPRVLVLLTDGSHNGPNVPPLVTARAAAALHVRIHAISILSPDEAADLATSIVRRQFGDERETVLQQLANLTGGRYFRATSAAALDSIYGEIDRVEAPLPHIVTREIRQPLAPWLFLLGLMFLGAEALLRGSRWGIVH